MRAKKWINVVKSACGGALITAKRMKIFVHIFMQRKQIVDSLISCFLFIFFVCALKHVLVPHNVAYCTILLEITNWDFYLSVSIKHYNLGLATYMIALQY